jgi:two-component system sensor histidine kinase HupT/HoxJ
MGIPEAALGKIFDPFFTTKDVGKGTGLGLSLAAKIAGEHGGDLRYDETHPNTCFRLRLPLATD